MCEQLIETTKHRCGCRIDSCATVKELDGCNKCGIIKKNAYLAQLTRRYPCPDCITNGVWAKKNGKWEKVKPKA